MVGDLEQVPAASVLRDDLEQVGVVVVLEVTGEQDPLSADAYGEHQRGPVDGPAVGQDAIGDGVLRWPEHLHAGVTEGEGVALRQAVTSDAVAPGRRTQLEDGAAL